MSPRSRLARELINHTGRCDGRVRWRADHCATATALAGVCWRCGWLRVLVEDRPHEGPPLRAEGHPDWLPAAVKAAFDEENTR